MANSSETGARRRSRFGRTNMVMRFNAEGMELVRVRRRQRWMPAWHLVFFIYMAFLIRIVVMADMGPTAYDQRVTQLKNGNVLEKVAGLVMHMDPVSRVLAMKLRHGLTSVQAVFEREVWDGGI